MAPLGGRFAAPTLAHRDAAGGAIHTINGGLGSRRKVHLAIDESTLEGEPASAVEVTDSRIGDAPMLPGLLSQIPTDEPIASVTADGAYDGVRRRSRTGGDHRLTCRDAIATRGAEALAIVLEPMAHKARSHRAGMRIPGRRTVQAPCAATTTCAR